MTIFMVTHRQAYFFQQVRNVYYYETALGDPSVAEWKDIVDEIRALYLAQFNAFQPVQYQFIGIDYREVDTAGLPAQSVDPTLGALIGAGVVDGLATQMAMVVNVKGGTLKPRIGRVFLCGFDEGMMTQSQWDSGILANAETFVDGLAILNSAGTNQLDRVAVQWNVSHTVVTAFNDISTVPAIATAIPATIRSRRIGVGI